MHRRTFCAVMIALAFQSGSILYPAADELVFYFGLFWLVLGVCTTGLTFFGQDIDIGSMTLTGSQIGGVAMVMIGIGWMAYPVALWLDEGFGVYEGLWTVASLAFIWGGILMIRDHERARLLEPGESGRDRIEKVGWSNHPLAVLKGEAMRSIGVFGLLFLPTLMIVAIDPSLSRSDLVVYLPAAVLTFLHATIFAWIRIRTDAGPHYTQVIDAVRRS